jgi:excisionase family DNA binding protein
MTVKLLRPDQVAEILSVSKRQVYMLVREGELIGHNQRPGKRGLRILAESIEQYLEKHKINPESFLE